MDSNTGNLPKCIKKGAVKLSCPEEHLELEEGRVFMKHDPKKSISEYRGSSAGFLQYEKDQLNPI